LTSCLPDEELVSLARNVPLVVTGRAVVGERIYCLDQDCTLGARVVTDYLVGQGHRRIAFISGPPDHPDALQRLGGYKAALAAARIPFASKLVVAGDYLETGGYAAANALLDAGVEFSAVFAANDQTAFGVLLALHRRGIRVPQDVSVVGFDDLPASAVMIPPLTTVHRYTDEIGERAAEAIIDSDDEWDEPDYRISEGEPYYPDDWDDEAEWYYGEPKPMAPLTTKRSRRC
jgi:LacI family transcriptional regulator